jgi:hypothetical protein
MRIIGPRLVRMNPILKRLVVLLARVAMCELMVRGTVHSGADGVCAHLETSCLPPIMSGVAPVI